MKKVLGILALIGLIAVSIGNRPTTRAQQIDNPNFSPRCSYSVDGICKESISTVTDNYFDNVRKLETERRHHCWVEGDRHCTANSRW